MRRAAVLLMALSLVAACNQNKEIDRSKGVANIDLNQTVARAKTQADREHPDATAKKPQPKPRPGYAWVGDWARRASLCPFRRWHLDRVRATLPDGTACTIQSVSGEVIGGDRLALACSNRGMKSNEIWLAKFLSLDQVRITRTVGAGVPTVVPLVRCG